MEDGRVTARKARQVSVSVYPEHDAVLYALRMQRGQSNRDIPKVSDLFQEAILVLAERDLPPAQFAELTGVESDAIALAS